MARTVIKLGSSTVVDADGRPRLDVIERVAAAVATRRNAGDDVLVVSSGAIAHGMGIMGRTGRTSVIEDLQAASAVGQGRLFRVWDEQLTAHGVQPAQILLTFFDLMARTHYLNARATLERVLAWGVVPVINENDTTTTDEISFGDNDFLAAQVAVLAGADRLILLTDIDGLFTADPRLHPDAEIVREVADFEGLSALDIGHSTSPLGSGGMRSKVVAAEMASAAGIATVVANGVTPGVLDSVLAGEPEGTRFAAAEARHSSFKLWLKYAKPARGTIVVDDGAARALRSSGTSLLPVGITDVRGDFDAGDAVSVCHGPVVIGKGICSYTADELRQVAGLQSARVQEVLPRASEEAVHRDYFVLV